ncbi:hypothetical protein AWE51_19735 [Aquimarina aggregata]|uniref:Uncharacterized protein n=1 Tax=Aquimarina aggregata TaxID=1642818 RepID=A0A163BQ36_9FLAO|nr:hypothetical protein [Aquimarina aggregata]KZS41633.1 hypothetical protein AWE51_19735 [Aquimarina aggregata]
MKSLNIKTIIALSTLVTSIFLISYGNNNEAIQEYYSGEEIFRGIFFLEGEAAYDLTVLRAKVNPINETINTKSIEIQKLSRDIKDEIIEEIKNLNPDFFDDFRKHINSTDHHTIDLAITNGSEIIKIVGLNSKK